MQKSRRFALIINEFQNKLLVRFVLYWLVYQVTLWNFLFGWQLLREGKGNLLEQFVRFCGENYPMLICLTLVVPFFAWDAMRFSHHVAGPIYRIHETVRAITANEPLRRVKLRDGDYLTDVADDVNAMLEALELRGAVTLRHPASATTPAAEPPQQLCGDLQGTCHEKSSS